MPTSLWLIKDEEIVKVNKNFLSYKKTNIMIAFSIILKTFSAYSVDEIHQPSGYVSIYNACTEPVWLFTTWTHSVKKNDDKPGFEGRKYHRLDKVLPGKQFDFEGTDKTPAAWPLGSQSTYNMNPNSWNGVNSMRIIAKFGCKDDISLPGSSNPAEGVQCEIGESDLLAPMVGRDDPNYDHIYFSPKGTNLLFANEYFRNLKSKDSMLADIYGNRSVARYPQPSIDTGFEATFMCNTPGAPSAPDNDGQECQINNGTANMPLTAGNYYDVSLVDGFTVPMFVKVFQAQNESSLNCSDIDASNHMPIPDLFTDIIPRDVLARGDRLEFNDACSMECVETTTDYLSIDGQNAPNVYNFSNYLSVVSNPSINKVIGCAAPKTRLLLKPEHSDPYLFQWFNTRNQADILPDLYGDVDNGSHEYDSRVIAFTCPYGQGNIDDFKCYGYDNRFINKNTKELCERPGNDQSYTLKYVSPYDKAQTWSNNGQYSPLYRLINRALYGKWPEFKADQTTQGVTFLCGGRYDDPNTGPVYPAEKTKWTKTLRDETTNVYTYTYDDRTGLRKCNNVNSNVLVVLCGDEQLINEHLPGNSTFR